MGVKVYEWIDPKEKEENKKWMDMQIHLERDYVFNIVIWALREFC